MMSLRISNNEQSLVKGQWLQELLLELPCLKIVQNLFGRQDFLVELGGIVGAVLTDCLAAKRGGQVKAGMFPS